MGVMLFLSKRILNPEQRRVWALFAGEKLRFKTYTLLRLWSCPFDRVARFVPQSGRVLDLGCGFGIFAFYLFFSSGGREITGIDREAGRVRLAADISRRTDAKICFVHDDVRNGNWGKDFDCVALIDVLYLLPEAENRDLLVKCFRNLSEKGILVIKEIDRRPALKYWWCRFQENIFSRRPGLPRRPFHWPGADRLRRMVAQAGFRVREVRVDQGYPYSHFLLIGEK